MSERATIEKAKRRIRRFLKTGKQQHRISREEGTERNFTWRGGTKYGKDLRFRVDKLKRIYQI